jgi:hypothetical protein
MAGDTLTTADAILKQHYASGPLLNLAAQQNTTYGLLTKKNKRTNTSGGGRSWTQPIRISYPGGGSADFATAMAATNNASGFGVFTVTRKSHYRLAKMSTELVEATDTGAEDAFEDMIDELDRGIEAEANYLNFRLFRSQGGSSGVMTNSAFNTTIITLNDPSDAWAWVKNDVINLANTDGTSGAIKAGSLTVASVQRTAGTITTTANISTGVATAAQNDNLFLAGDFAAVNTAISGFRDWMPDAAPSATPFYGQDRSIEPEMLGGLRVDASTSGAPVHEVLIDMMAKGDQFGAMFDTFIMHPLATADLTKQLEGKWAIVKAQDYDGDAEVGYKGWNVSLNGKDVTIVTDRHCPQKRVYGLQIDTWTLFSAGTAPMFLQKRTGAILKVSENADALEARIGQYANLSNKGPGWNVVGLLP